MFNYDAPPPHPCLNLLNVILSSKEAENKQRWEMFDVQMMVQILPGGFSLQNGNDITVSSQLLLIKDPLFEFHSKLGLHITRQICLHPKIGKKED